MVSPITGPTTVTLNQDPTYYRRQSKWSQAKPVDRPLGYECSVGTRLRATGNAPAVSTQILNGQTSYPTGFLAFNTGLDNQVAIQAYDRFKGSISEGASLGAALVEARQSVSMVGNRLLQMFSFARAVRRGRLGDAYDILQGGTRIPTMSRPRNYREASADWASAFLEFHFGWAPLVSDIYSAINVLQNPYKSTRVRGRAMAPYTKVVSSGTPGGVVYTRNTDSLVSRCEYGCEISISNPNLYLANQLGLVNPAVVLWEVVPFSFVVDWFANVEQFLSTGSDFVGLNVQKAYTTRTITGNRQYFQSSYGNVTGTGSYRGTRMIRTLGVVTPSLGLRPARLWGWRRIAAAASLVMQKLRP